MRETVFLNTDREMPLLGLGVYKTADNEAETAITAAVNAGYRLIDTASAYKNEESVGKAIAKCGVPRKELFITSKIWNNAQRLGDVDGAFYRSMERLKLDYLDLYLIHWPVPGCYTGTWLEMAKLLETVYFPSASAISRFIIWKSLRKFPVLYLLSTRLNVIRFAIRKN